jgi:2'-5' RNA ligase
MKRLFAALKIHPDDDFLEIYRDLQQELSHEQIKWVEERNIHVTLKFFGETEERTIPAIADILRKRASLATPFNMQLSGLGIFGSSYAPKVVWVGIEPYTALSNLMKNIHEDLRTAGFEPDRQNLVPHLTLGRIKFLRDKICFQRAINKYKTIASASLLIHEAVLFESILRREGPEYIALEKFPFLKKELP